MDGTWRWMFPLEAISPVPVSHSHERAKCAKGKFRAEHKKNGADCTAPFRLLTK
jgi:hypothetical protein